MLRHIFSVVFFSRVVLCRVYLISESGSKHSSACFHDVLLTNVKYLKSFNVIVREYQPLNFKLINGVKKHFMFGFMLINRQFLIN